MKSYVLTSLLALTLPVIFSSAHAETLDFNVERTQLKAIRVDTVDELAAFAKTHVNRSVEMRGTIKGLFSKGTEGFSLMLQIPEGQTLVISAPPELRQNVAISSGKWIRALCKINGYSGRDVDLILQNATDKFDNQAIDTPSYDDDVVIVNTNPRSIPSPDQILIAPEMNLPPAPKAVQVQGKVIQVPPSRGELPSRRAVVPRNQAPQTARSNSSNPYFGFTETHQLAYKNLAKRNNPRLTDELADKIASAILSASKAHNLDPRFLAAVVTVESRFNPYAVSSSGAMGLGQLMPFNLKPLGVGNAWDPMQNLHGSAKMLRQNLNTYAGKENGTLLAVAAYHAGVGAVNRAGYKVPKVSTNRYAWKVYYAYKALAPELF
jgi:hypothetical protein